MRLIPTSLTQRTVDPNDPTGGKTIDALRARQLALQKAAPEAPAQIASPWQGAAYLANVFANSQQQKQAEAEEAAGRQRLAQLIGGIDMATGATPQQLADIGTLDPDMETKLFADAMAQRRAEANYRRDRADKLTDTQAANQFALDKQQADWAHDDAKPLTDIGRLDADLKAGRITQAAYDEAVSKMQPDSYGPIVTGEEAKALGLDPAMQWQQNTKTGKWEKPGGAGINIQTVPSEVGARVALGDDFLANIDEVKRSAKAGEMTGPVDFTSAVLMGRGPGGAANRLLIQGSESLVRQLTGAGKSQSEAQSQAQQFLPTALDDSTTLLSKIEGLERQLRATREGATAGRKFPAAPAATGTAPAAGLPEGVTEEDIQETMRANGMTRDEVLERLGGANAGP